VLPRILQSVALAALLTTITGCGSPVEKITRPAPQPVITGEGSFFANRIQVVAQLGPFRLIDALPPSRVGGEPVAIDEPLTTSRPRANAIPGPRGNGVARQSLTVTLRNIGDTPIELRVAEVRSALGNFVPVPEIFTLEPGQIQGLEPMRAFYPATIDELELVIRLRTREAQEVQTLHLIL
jgi:hypothetical protein